MSSAAAQSPDLHAGKRGKAEVRLGQIAEHVTSRGASTPQELAAEFGVSIMTIHRDLEQLERRGIVRRFHGGVTAQPSGVFESQMSYRLMSHTDEKARIARAALEVVEPGMSVVLDDSTTALHMIDGLAERAPLHIATTFLEALRRLSKAAEDHDITIIGLGGTYDLPHDSFVGLQCLEQIAGLRPDIAFMSTSAISLTDALHQEERIVALKRAMIAAAARRYLLVDHTKIGRPGLHKVVPLTTFDCIYTDNGVDPSVLAAWDAAGIRYKTV